MMNYFCKKGLHNDYEMEMVSLCFRISWYQMYKQLCPTSSWWEGVWWSQCKYSVTLPVVNSVHNYIFIMLESFSQQFSNCCIPPLLCTREVKKIAHRETLWEADQHM